MNKMFIEVLIIKQRLKDITLTEPMVIEKELNILTSMFIKVFRKNNVEQIKNCKKIVQNQIKYEGIIK